MLGIVIKRCANYSEIQEWKGTMFDKMNINNYRITVLMGIYNCAQTLQEALDSLYAQTYQGFKIVLCDDGSTDETLAIAEANARMHKNVIVIRNERNLGLNYTLNHCLEYADTEYCARMDGDDISMPNRFEKEINFLDSHQEYAFVSCPMVYFNENGIFRVGNESGEPSIQVFPKKTPFCHAPCMVRTEAYGDVGGYSVDDTLLRVEDYHLWIKMYAKGYRGFILSEPLYKMRDDKNAIRRRTWQGAINEFRVKNMAVSYLHLPFIYRLFSLRPIIIHLLPAFVYKIIHNRY